MIEVEVRSSTRIELVGVATKAAAAVAGLDRGATLCQVFVPHPTVAVVINERPIRMSSRRPDRELATNSGSRSKSTASMPGHGQRLSI